MGDFANWNNAPNQTPRREYTPYSKDTERSRRIRIVIAILWILAILVASWFGFIFLKNELAEASGAKFYQVESRPVQGLERPRSIGGSHAV